MRTYCILCGTPFIPTTHRGFEDYVCEDHATCITEGCDQAIYPQGNGGDGDHCADCLLEQAMGELKDATMQPMSEDYAPELKKAGVFVKQAQGIVDAIEAEYKARFEWLRQRVA